MDAEAELKKKYRKIQNSLLMRIMNKKDFMQSLSKKAIIRTESSKVNISLPKMETGPELDEKARLVLENMRKAEEKVARKMETLRKEIEESKEKHKLREFDKDENLKRIKRQEEFRKKTLREKLDKKFHHVKNDKLALERLISKKK